MKLAARHVCILLGGVVALLSGLNDAAFVGTSERAKEEASLPASPPPPPPRTTSPVSPPPSQVTAAAAPLASRPPKSLIQAFLPSPPWMESIHTIQKHLSGRAEAMIKPHLPEMNQFLPSPPEIQHPMTPGKHKRHLVKKGLTQDASGRQHPSLGSSTAPPGVGHPDRHQRKGHGNRELIQKIHQTINEISQKQILAVPLLKEVEMLQHERAKALMMDLTKLKESHQSYQAKIKGLDGLLQKYKAQLAKVARQKPAVTQQKSGMTKRSSVCLDRESKAILEMLRERDTKGGAPNQGDKARARRILHLIRSRAPGQRSN